MDVLPLWISLKTAIVATGISFLLGILAAYQTLQWGKKAKIIFDVLFTLPLVLPPTVAGYLLLILFGKRGILGKALDMIGVTVVFSWSAAVIAAVVVSFPLMYRSAKAAFQLVDPNILNAAKTLGLARIKIFWKILMPLSFPGIASGAILSFARALGEFGATIMIAGNIPNKTQTMPLSIYMAILSGDYKEARLWVIIMIIISFLSIFGMNYLTEKERKTLGGGSKA